MSAIHPLTGKPIKIIESEGCVWRDEKTLVWLDKTVSAESKWNRFDVGVSSVEVLEALGQKGIVVDICIAIGFGAAKWIQEGGPKSVRIFATSKAVIDEVGPEFFIKERVANMICLDDALGLYPMLQVPWNGSEMDARLMLALILQYKRTGPVLEGADKHRLISSAAYGLSKETTLSPPRPLYFITQFFVSPKPRRSAEIVHTLQKNAECNYVDKIILLNERQYELPVSSLKIEQHVIGHRLNFRTVLQYIYEKVPSDVLVVIANSDIYLDDSWRLLWSLSMRSTFLSLLRWDVQENPQEKPVLFGPRSDSQDTWVISSNSVKERSWNWPTLDIPFGQNGCDNAINVEMLRNKYMVANPCMSLTTNHVHTSGIRTYKNLDILSKPIFMYLKPTGIHDLKPEYELSQKTFQKIEVPLYQPPIRCVNSAVFRTMLCKQNDDFKRMGVIFPSHTVNLHTYENVFETKDGLLQTYNTILVGGSKVVSDMWGETEMSVLSPCVAVETAVVAFCPNHVAQSPWLYMVNYLGKILHMRRLVGGGEFLGTEEMRGVLEKFSWRLDTDPPGKKEIPVLLREENFQAWCSRAHVWYPQGGLKDQITAQEVKALRESVFRRRMTGGHMVFCLDKYWITKEFVAEVERVTGIDAVIVEEGDTVEETMDFLTTAAGLIGMVGGGPLWGSWLLPTDSFVFELQLEATPSIDIAHLCCVCEVEHYVQTVHRIKPQNKIDTENVVAALCAYTKKRGSSHQAPSLEILMPPSSTTGFFAHAGDSFREMVRLWAERGYVTIKEMPGLCNVWLGGVGQVLLYDRPTLEWFHASPLEEQEWCVGLFGNPAATKAMKSTAWSFWPRRPRIVEELAYKPRPPFSERTMRVVFYGRSENVVQFRNRTKASWSSACSEFVHLESAVAKYPYTHEEYLERLRRSLFGLCLAGYGKKCHREIECMAMGCVPVVAPEVDMTSYASPPVEGVHYLRVIDQDDLRKKTEAMDEAAWEAMSAAAFQWWKENASTEGMWALTKRLAGI